MPFSCLSNAITCDLRRRTSSIRWSSLVSITSGLLTVIDARTSIWCGQVPLGVTKDGACPLRRLPESANDHSVTTAQGSVCHAPASVAVTGVTSYPSSTPSFFGHRVRPALLWRMGDSTAKHSAHGQKIALTAIVDQTNNLPLARSKTAVVPVLSDSLLDADVPGDDSVFGADAKRRRRYLSQRQFCV
jgi:hypothetical protein